MIVKLLTEHHLESTYVKMPPCCWNPHALALIIKQYLQNLNGGIGDIRNSI